MAGVRSLRSLRRRLAGLGILIRRILAQLGQLRSDPEFGFLVLPSHFRGQIVLARRTGVRAQLG